MKHNLSLVVILPCLAISCGSYAEVVQAESKNPIQKELEAKVAAKKTG